MGSVSILADNFLGCEEVTRILLLPVGIVLGVVLGIAMAGITFWSTIMIFMGKIDAAGFCFGACIAIATLGTVVYQICEAFK